MKKYIEYLPEFLRNIEEFNAIGSCEDVILQDIGKYFQDTENSQWIGTSGERGLERREKIMGISVLKGTSDDERRKIIMSKWNNYIPYTYYTIRSWLESICGKDNFELRIDYEGYKVIIELGLDFKNYENMIYSECRVMIPANMILILNIIYTRHSELTPFTYSGLSIYTHRGIRENEIALNLL